MKNIECKNIAMPAAEEVMCVSREGSLTPVNVFLPPMHSLCMVSHASHFLCTCYKQQQHVVHSTQLQPLKQIYTILYLDHKPMLKWVGVRSERKMAC